MTICVNGAGSALSPLHSPKDGELCCTSGAVVGPCGVRSGRTLRQHNYHFPTVRGRSLRPHLGLAARRAVRRLLTGRRRTASKVGSQEPPVGGLVAWRPPGRGQPGFGGACCHRDSPLSASPGAARWRTSDPFPAAHVLPACLLAHAKGYGCFRCRVAPQPPLSFLRLDTVSKCGRLGCRLVVTQPASVRGTNSARS